MMPSPQALDAPEILESARGFIAWSVSSMLRLSSKAARFCKEPNQKILAPNPSLPSGQLRVSSRVKRSRAASGSFNM